MINYATFLIKIEKVGDNVENDISILRFNLYCVLNSGYEPNNFAKFIVLSAHGYF